MAAASSLRLITFRAGPETFVLDIMALRQIVPFSGCTAVPTAPSFIEGIIILRDEVIPIVDLRRRLYPSNAEERQDSLVLITHTSAGVIGFKVDEVRRIITVDHDALLPPPAIVRGIRGELLIAVIAHGNETLLVIDLESVLSDDEKVELQSAALQPV